MTYTQAYDKIIQAYFKDEIRPYSDKFCFCGTLANNTSAWTSYFRCDKLAYSYKEFGKMEFALLQELGVTKMSSNSNISCGGDHLYIGDKNYEDALFKGMCAALEVLKQIHKERGEDVDETLSLTKRKKEEVNIPQSVN